MGLDLNFSPTNQRLYLCWMKTKLVYNFLKGKERLLGLGGT
jgi:hypothetical protein